MTFIQEILLRALPKQWAEEMHTESLKWMIRCVCGFERSIWESGGVRWKSKGNPRILRFCPKCKQLGWHNVYRKTE